MIDGIRQNRSALVQEVQSAGSRVRGNSMSCFLHEDNHPSAGVYQGKDGVYRFKCQSCGWNGDIYDLRAKLTGRPLAEILKESKPKTDKPMRTTNIADSTPKLYPTIEDLRAAVRYVTSGTIQAEYDYHNSKGEFSFRVFRCKTADGKQIRPGIQVAGGWNMKFPEGLRCLFNLAAVQEADTVIVVEGEPKVVILQEHDFPAVCSSAGAKSAKYSDWRPLAGKNVVIWPDADPEGLGYAKDVESILSELEPRPRIAVIDPASLDLKDGEDVVDFVNQLRAL